MCGLDFCQTDTQNLLSVKRQTNHKKEEKTSFDVFFYFSSVFAI